MSKVKTPYKENRHRVSTEVNRGPSSQEKTMTPVLRMWAPPGSQWCWITFTVIDSVPSSTLCRLWFPHTSHSFLPSLTFFTFHKHTDHGNRGSQSKDKMWPCSVGKVTVFGPAWGGRLRGLCGPDMVGLWWGTRQSSWYDHRGLGQMAITVWIRPEEP